MNVDWRSGLPPDRRVVDPGEHGSYPSPTAPAVAAGGLVLTSGIVGMDADRRVVAGGAGAQTTQTLSLIARSLEAYDAGLGDVVRLTVHLASIDDVEEASAALDAAFGRPWPPTTMVAVARLAMPELLVEIDCVAALRTG